MEIEEGGEIDDAISCPDQILALAEPTTLRMQAYMTTCQFSPSDVDVSSPHFALTTAGRQKLCQAPCQAAAVLENSPLNVLAAAQTLSTQCEDEALTSQISPVGLFAAATEMDTHWRACAEGGVEEGDAEEGFHTKDTPIR